MSRQAILMGVFISASLGLAANMISADAMGVSDLKDSNPQAYQKMEDEQEHASDMETVQKSNVGIRKYFTNLATVPTLSMTDKSRPRTDAIDISSHQGNISVDSFKKMKTNGVKTVLVKLTEFTTYQNPYAKSQIANARAAGLQVGGYHYSWFENDVTARSEARYFAKMAKSVGLSANDVMANDLEEPYTKTNSVNQNIMSFRDELHKQGFNHTVLYTYKNYFDEKLKSTSYPKNEIWMAQYPFDPKANNLWNTNFGAWQFTSQMTIPGVSGNFDASIDYKNLLTTRTFAPTTPGSSSSSSTSSHTSSGQTSSSNDTSSSQSSSGTDDHSKQSNDTDAAHIGTNDSNIDERSKDYSTLKSNLTKAEQPKIKKLSAKTSSSDKIDLPSDKKDNNARLKATSQERQSSIYKLIGVLAMISSFLFIVLNKILHHKSMTKRSN